MSDTENIFSALESVLGRSSPASIVAFYTAFDQTHCPGEFYDIPVDLFDNMDRLLIQYFNPINDMSDLQTQRDAYYFCFAAGQDELDWWLRIDRTSGIVNVCSTYVGTGNRLTDLQCYQLTFDKLIRCPYRSTGR